MKTPAVVLAAGLSSRYPVGNKLLAGFGGQSLMAHVIEQIMPAADPVIVVTGHQAGRLRQVLRQAFDHADKLHFVHNPSYRDGMAGSLRLGIAALPASAPKAFLCLSDMPGIDARLLQRLSRAWQPELDFVRPVCRKRPGHPVLVSRRLFTAFESLTGDAGAKPVLAQVPCERQRRIPWHEGCILDTDTPAALRRAQRHYRRTKPGWPQRTETAVPVAGL